MILLKQKDDIQQKTKQLAEKNISIGFVPTMGALHRGHISLIEEAKKNNEFVICSIFINPTQFGNETDLQKYPVTLEQDINMLEEAGCDLLFLPTIKTMYPEGALEETYELGYLETILEGIYRPGHFQGVCIIVDKLLMLIKPSNIYLGKKDYQQCMVIKKMMVEKYSNCKINLCETVREHDGLAMSSRNLRLNEAERLKATEIFETLKYINDNITPENLSLTQSKGILKLNKSGFKVDYVSIANAETLLPIDKWNGETTLVALIAAYLNEIRLIDNIVLQPAKK